MSEETFRLLVEQVSDYAIFMLDPRGRVSTWNAGAERIKGYRASEIIGQHLSRFYPEEDIRAGKCEMELEEATRVGRFEDYGWRLRKDGSRFWANVVITALRDPQGKLAGFAKVTRDLTEQKRAEEERLRETAARESAERALSLLARLQSWMASLAAARTPEDVASALVKQGAVSVQASSALLLRRGSGDKLLLMASQGAPEALLRALNGLPVSARVPAAAALRTAMPQWLETPEEYASQAPDFPPGTPAAASVAALPLVMRGEASAVLVFRFERRREFAADERALMETFAVQAAQALDRADVYAQELATRRRVEALGLLAESLSSALTTDDVARVVVQQGRRAAHADTCTLYALDETTKALELVAERGISPAIVDAIRRISPDSKHAVYRTIVTRESVWAETDEAYRKFDPELASMRVDGPRAHAFWSVPLVAEGRVIGLLGMGFYGARSFPEEERDFAETFTRHCAEALLRARRFDTERAAKSLAEKLQASFSTTLRSIGDAVIATDATGKITLMNAVAEALTGWREDEARGHPLPEVFRIVNEQTREPVPSPVEKVLEKGLVVGLANHTVLVAKGGREIPIDDSGAPIRGERGAIDGVVLVFRDVTEKKREESRRAFLEEATVALVDSLDYETTLAKVAQLAVPRLADWCAVDMVQEGEALPKRLAVAHVDPGKIALAREIEAKYPPRPDAPTGVPNVLRTGKSELYPDVPDELLVAGCVDAEHLRLARALQLRSAMVVPLLARGRTLGAVTFVLAESGRAYTERDLQFAEDLASRCAIAVENARLFASESHARHAADVANRAKDEFLAVVSHELRTPLNAIMGWAKLMSTPGYDETRRTRAMETIERNAVAMAQLIEDLLDVSRIISGKMRLDVKEVELARIVEAAMEGVRPAAEAKDIHFSSVLSTTVPALIGDPTRLQQIVWNLLSNAVKFTSKGGRVEVVLRLEESWAELCVADTGKGIAPAFLPHVFEAFRQEDASHSRSRGGIGLGLAITRQLVELHGGRIEARSEGEGCGATFIVRLPISAVARTTPTSARGDVRRISTDGGFEHPAQLQRLKVLVVDDESDARALVKEILEECGCRVRTAGGVEEAMTAFAEEVPDVLVSDIGMPGQDGYDLIRRVRARAPDQGGDVAAAALTAYTRAEDRRRMLNAGYSMHIPKPVEPAELVAVVTSLTRFARVR